MPWATFAALLQEISLDPAMMVWLDTKDSKRGMPNENYARELMELFSLGIGNYTEQDIREAARAFTGYEIKDRQDHAQYYPARRHVENGPRQIRPVQSRGHRQHLPGAEIVSLLHRRQVVRFLVSDSITPDRELLEPLAEEFRKSSYDFGKLVERMLRSNLFFSTTPFARRSSRRWISPSASSGLWKATSQHSRWPKRWKVWASGSLSAIGQRLGRRPGLAERANAALPAEPGPGPDVHRRRPFRSRTDPAGSCENTMKTPTIIRWTFS